MPISMGSAKAASGSHLLAGSVTSQSRSAVHFPRNGNHGLAVHPHGVFDPSIVSPNGYNLYSHHLARPDADEVPLKHDLPNAKARFFDTAFPLGIALRGDRRSNR
jgi:hypothetical protein